MRNSGGIVLLDLGQAARDLVRSVTAEARNERGGEKGRH